MAEKFDVQVFVEEGCETNQSILKLIESNQGLQTEILNHAQDMGEKAVNVPKTMHRLVAVGKLLQIADLGSDSLHSNIAVKGMIMDYQSMVHESTATLFKFRGNCRTAIENHVLAIELYQEDAYAESLSILAENKPLAAEMAKESELLQKRADKLLQDAVSALKKVQEEDIQCKERKEELDQQLAELKANMEEKKKFQEIQEQNLDALNETLKETWDRQDKQAEREHSTKILQMIMTPVTEILTTVTGSKAVKIATAGFGAVSDTVKNFGGKIDEDVTKNVNTALQNYQAQCSHIDDQISDLKKEINKKITDQEKKDYKDQIENLRKEKSQIMNQYANQSKAEINEPKSVESGLIEMAKQQQQQLLEMQREQARTEGELAKIVSKLESDKLQIGDLETAIKMIAMLINVLGQIKTTFENLKLFWKMQESECTQLQKLCQKNEDSLEKLAANDGKGKAEQMKLKRSVRQSVVKWATLFKVNHDGFLSIENAKNTIDSVMMNLGNLDEKGQLRSRKETEVYMRVLLRDAKELMNLYSDEKLTIESAG